MEQLKPLHVPHSPAQHLHPHLLEDGSDANGDDVMHERWGRLGGHEGEFPSFIQEQLKGSQEFASWEGVAGDGEPV